MNKITADVYTTHKVDISVDTLNAIISDKGDQLSIAALLNGMRLNLYKSFRIDSSIYGNARVDLDTGNWVTYRTMSGIQEIRKATKEEIETWNAYENLSHIVFLNKLNK